MVQSKYLTEASLFAPAADSWARVKGIVNNNGGLSVLVGANNFSDVPDVYVARINLGVQIGSDVQEYSVRLDQYASAAFPSPFFLSLVNKQNGAEIRSTIGAGTVTSVTIAGGNTGISFSGGSITSSGILTLGGTLSVDHGGTGVTTLVELKQALSLDEVDNTRDIDKPISTATQEALDTKASKDVATVSTDGLMAASDKVKLNSLLTPGKFEPVRFDAPLSATWIIPHGLGRIPMVQIYLSSGELVMTDVVATQTTITVTFNQPVQGFVLAY